MMTPKRHIVGIVALVPPLLLSGASRTRQAPPFADGPRVIRVNQLGYLPNAPKTAVMCVLADSTAAAASPPATVSFSVQDTTGRQALAPRNATAAGAFGPCAETYRLDFSAVRTPGR